MSRQRIGAEPAQFDLRLTDGIIRHRPERDLRMDLVNSVDRFDDVVASSTLVNRVHDLRAEQASPCVRATECDSPAA